MGAPGDWLAAFLLAVLALLALRWLAHQLLRAVLGLVLMWALRDL